MKQLFYILILVLCFSACGGSPKEVKLKGEIKGLTNDTIYIYGNDELSNLKDSLYVVDGKISHTIKADTLFHAMLVLNNEQEYPIYLDKGKTITINGDLNNSSVLTIKGLAPNEELTAFKKSIEGFSTNPNDTAVLNRAEQFIRINQTSPASIYILDKYFVQKEVPDLDKIRELISFMDGSLQDKPYIEKLSKKLEQAEKSEPGKPAITFSLPDVNGKMINRTRYRNSYLLVNFYASWCDSCETANAELRKIYKKYKDHSRFAMLGVSLDMDRDSWKNTIKQDTLKWDQVCDFMGWDNTLVNQYGVYTIPYNILLGTDGRVLERNIKGDALMNKLEELLKDDEK